jgi:hypothetical protein
MLLGAGRHRNGNLWTSMERKASCSTELPHPKPHWSEGGKLWTRKRAVLLNCRIRNHAEVREENSGPVWRGKRTVLLNCRIRNHSEVREEDWTSIDKKASCSTELPHPKPRWSEGGKLDQYRQESELFYWTGLDWGEEKISCPYLQSNLNSSAVQPVDCRYTGLSPALRSVCYCSRDWDGQMTSCKIPEMCGVAWWKESKIGVCSRIKLLGSLVA